jgi:hypothetical protein
MTLRKARARFSKSASRTGAAIRAALLLSLGLAAAATGFARADDFGPRGDLRELRFVAQHLLAHGARDAKIDPAAVRIFDIVAVNNGALLSWDTPFGNGLIGLVRHQGRWWKVLDYHHDLDGWAASVYSPLEPKCPIQSEIYPSAAKLIDDGMPEDVVNVAQTHNGNLMAQSMQKRKLPRLMSDRFCGTAPGALSPLGGTVWQDPVSTAGYDISVGYTANNSSIGTTLGPIYARAPTAAEIIPYPTTLHFLSTSVCYFDLTIEGTKPVTFAPGTTIDIWFPFVLDDALSYDLTIGFAREPIGPIYAKPFDNVLHYKLPGFTAVPGQTLMAEIDGNWP